MYQKVRQKVNKASKGINNQELKHAKVIKSFTCFEEEKTRLKNNSSKYQDYPDFSYAQLNDQIFKLKFKKSAHLSESKRL